jgi:hypothetical protein
MIWYQRQKNPKANLYIASIAQILFTARLLYFDPGFLGSACKKFNSFLILHIVFVITHRIAKRGPIHC